MAKLLQNKISESNFTLPISAVYGALLWLVSGQTSDYYHLQFIMFAVSVALMMELNNRNALLRIRSRMVSASYIFLFCMANFLFASISASTTALGTTLMLTLLFMQYHDKKSQGRTFYTFAIISTVSLVWIQMLFFVPVIWLMMLLYIQNMSWLTLAASVIGMAAPYWFAAAYFFITDDMATLMAHIAQLAEFEMPVTSRSLQPYQTITFTAVAVLAVIGAAHYIRNSFKDKIHNRMLYSCFAWLDITAALFLLLQPQHYKNLITMMIVFTSPLIAHFMALTNTRWTNITACVITISVIIITVLNLWMPSLLCFSAMDI